MDILKFEVLSDLFGFFLNNEDTVLCSKGSGIERYYFFSKERIICNTTHKGVAVNRESDPSMEISPTSLHFLLCKPLYILEEDHTIGNIPWEVLNPSITHVAMDKDGSIHAFDWEPSVGKNYPNEGEWIKNVPWVTLTIIIDKSILELPDTKYWDKSLTKRPE